MKEKNSENMKNFKKKYGENPPSQFMIWGEIQPFKISLGLGIIPLKSAWAMTNFVKNQEKFPVYPQEKRNDIGICEMNLTK